jgi:hypothetical protein
LPRRHPPREQIHTCTHARTGIQAGVRASSAHQQPPICMAGGPARPA